MCWQVRASTIQSAECAPGEAIMTDTRSSNDFGQTSEEGIPQLLRQLADQGTHLARQQAQLIQAEVKESVHDLMQAAGAMAGAAVVGLAGLGVLLMGLAYLLAEVMELWLATLIVAAVSLLIAFILYRSGMKKIQDSAFDAERTRRTLERAPGAISGHSNGTSHDR
jgi:hypothetical protein